MGRSSSKLMEAPNNPLQELQYLERKRAHQRQKLEKEQKQIAKLQKKHAKKLKKKQAAAGGRKSSGQSQSSPALGQRGHGGGATATTQRHRGSVSSSCRTLRGELSNRAELNRQTAAKMQTQLDGDLCAFVMNQVTLAQQFFGNYDSEITAISADLLEREKEYNQRLEEHSILLTSPLDMTVGKWISYRPLHGVEKNNAQLLQRPAMYVVFENIDIARPIDANYDSISPLCRVDMETECHQSTPCREDNMDLLRENKWKGYVRLKLRENPKGQATVAAVGGLEEIYTDSSSSGYSTSSAYSSQTIRRTISTESDYDYAFIAHLNTPHPLAELQMSNQRERAQLEAKVLPESCVSSLGGFVEAWQEEESDDEEHEDSEEEEEDAAEDDRAPTGYEAVSVGLQQSTDAAAGKDYETIEALRLHRVEQERRRVLLQQRYLNSKEFMSYFGELMRQKLCHQLQIPATELASATYRGSSIYTSNLELIPAIHVPQNAHHWPDCAFQFRIRDRGNTAGSQASSQRRQWPTRAMIKTIESFGFHVLPLGCAPKRRRNPFRELEWRIAFPKAERYLERHLTHAQVRVFMTTKALVKTFVEPREQGKALMFALEHLRTHLFWECERNYANWPEESLGEVLLRFIDSFMRRLREKCLPDYFIEERNLFESIPEFSLVTLYSILADIMANPLMHLMVAYRYLQLPEQFFPKLNFRRLFDNLAENDVLKLRTFSKNARNLLAEQQDDAEQLLLVDEGAQGLLGMQQHREKTQGKLRRKTHLMRHHIEAKKKQVYAERRRSAESIDVEFFFDHNASSAPRPRAFNQGVENLRRTNVLELLLDHMIGVCAQGLRWRAVPIASICLRQAERICQMYHNCGCDIAAEAYRTVISDLAAQLEVLQNSGDASYVPHTPPPTLPMRPSVEPTRSWQTKEWLKWQDVPQPGPEDLRDDELHDIEQVLVECEHRLASVRESRDWHDGELSEPKKTIKFEEHVVEVHDGDSNPIQKRRECSPVSILRSTAIEVTANIMQCPLEVEESEDEAEEAEESNVVVQTATVNRVGAAVAAKLNTAADIIKNAPLTNAKGLQSLATSTEKLISKATDVNKRAQLREMLKRQAVQLKGVFNQPTNS